MLCSDFGVCTSLSNSNSTVNLLKKSVSGMALVVYVKSVVLGIFPVAWCIRNCTLSMCLAVFTGEKVFVNYKRNHIM